MLNGRPFVVRFELTKVCSNIKNMEFQATSWVLSEILALTLVTSTLKLGLACKFATQYFELHFPMLSGTCILDKSQPLGFSCQLVIYF